MLKYIGTFSNIPENTESHTNTSNNDAEIVYKDGTGGRGKGEKRPSTKSTGQGPRLALPYISKACTSTTEVSSEP